MNHYIIAFLFSILFVGCSQNATNSLNQSLVITSKKETISDLDSLEVNLKSYIKHPSVQKISIQEIFENSWLSSIQTNYSLDKSISVEIKEHHPIVSLDQGRFITQTGKSINPKGKFKELSLVSIKGPEDSLGGLINLSRELQTKLNKLDLRLISFELKNLDMLIAKDNSGTEYIFSSKEFRVQLERLEDFISFELNSGKRNHIRYMDFRYNNAVAIYRS